MQPFNNTVGVISDIQAPEILSFTLDLNVGILEITFTEEINSTTLDISRFVLTAGSNSSYYYGLTSSVGTINGSILTVNLSSVDLNAIKLNLQLAVDNETTNLLVNPMAVVDYSENYLEPIFNATALPTNMLISDSTAPVLYGFHVDLDVSRIVLTFSEPVSAESFNTSLISFSDGSPDTNITLSSSSTSTVNSPILYIMLSPEDNEALRVNTTFGSSTDNSVIFITSNAVADLNSNLFEGLSMPLTAANVVNDSTFPTLVGFELDLNSSVIILQFSEPINIENFNVDGLAIIPNETFTGPSIDLSSSTLISLANTSNVVINITNNINRIKALNILGTSESDTFLIIQDNIAFDLAGNALVAIREPGFGSTFVRPDEISPKIIYFTLNLDTEILSIRFSEPVDVLNFDISSLIFINESNGAELVRLTDGDASIIEYTLVNISLVPEDLNALKVLRSLATNINNTYISTELGFITDTSDNQLSAIPVYDPLQASEVIPDTIMPELISFTFSYDSGRISLTFSEAIDLQSFNVSRINLQNSAEIISPDTRIQLSNDSLPTSEESNVVMVTLNLSDLDQLMDAGLCLDRTGCFVLIQDNLVRDTSGNPIELTVLGATDVVVPSMRLRLEQFVILDYNSGSMNLLFSGSVLQSSVQFDQITLSLLAEMNTSIYTLTSGSVESAGSLLTINFSPVDLIQLKSRRISAQYALLVTFASHQMHFLISQAFQLFL